MTNKIKLDYPIEAEGRTINEISLRRIKARDLKNMDVVKGGDVAKSIDLVANLAELPPEVIEDLDAADFNKVSTMVAGFLEQK